MWQESNLLQLLSHSFNVLFQMCVLLHQCYHSTSSCFRADVSALRQPVGG